MAATDENLAGSVDNTETLRAILETQQSRPVTYDEAAEIGESLITFFEILGVDTRAETEEAMADEITIQIGGWGGRI
jgi:hypothetical protein